MIEFMASRCATSYPTAMNRWPLSFVVVAAACSSTPERSDSDRTYHCTVTQMRCGGGEKWPPGFDGTANGTTFTIALTGESIMVTDVATGNGHVVTDAFTCDGTWSGNTLACTLPTGTSCLQGAVTDVPFAVIVAGTNPNTETSLAAGQIWAGEWPGVPPTNLSAVCAR